ncbi:MAG: methionyl-tRNA formyltransferase [bacterium]|nr:methionyl-tRNA formyltransferase [bacterium]
MKEKIIFFGTPDFAVPALEALVQAGYDVVAVVTQPDKPVGRGLKMEAPAVKIAAQKFGLMVLQPISLNVVAEGFSLPNGGLKASATTPIKVFRELHADLGICVAYGKIIPKEILSIFPRGILNIHPSLLPKYRGPSPIQTAIRSGDEETGVTIMLLDEEMDHGPIATHITYHISHITTGSKLSQALAKDGARLLVDVLPKWLDGEIEAKEQNHSEATFTKMLEREDGRIDWNKPAEEIEKMVRAYDAWPGTFTVWNGKRLKILRVSLLHPAIGCADNAEPGYVFSVRSLDSRGSLGMTPITIGVNCNPGAIVLEELQLEGKKSMTGEEFLRGYPKFLHSILA